MYRSYLRKNLCQHHPTISLEQNKLHVDEAYFVNQLEQAQLLASLQEIHS